MIEPQRRAWLPVILLWALVASTIAAPSASAAPPASGTGLVELRPERDVVQHGETITVHWVLDGGETGGRVQDVVSLLDPAGFRAARALALIDEAVLPGERLEGSFRFTVARYVPEAGDWLLQSGSGPSSTITVEPAEQPLPSFEDMTRSAGLHDVSWRAANPVRCTPTSTGAGLGDIDGDEDLDLYVPAFLGGGRLYENDGRGNFSDVTRRAGLAQDDRARTAVVFVDVEGDGDLDLHVLADGIDELYRNDGHGRFVDVAPELGLDDGGPASSAAWDDVNGDGRLDVYVVVYGRCVASEFDLFESDRADRLYLQGPDGTFTRPEGVISDHRGFGFGALFTDVDDDGDRDLLVANDARIRAAAIQGDAFRRQISSIPPNRLLIDEGSTFRERGDQLGFASKMNSMGIAPGDVDGDSRIDYAISNMRASRLYGWDGDRMTDIAPRMDATRAFQDARTPTTAWGVVFVDVDLDGRRDLFMPTGAIGSGDDYFTSAESLKTKTLRMDYAAPNTLALLHHRGERFEDVTGAAGLLRNGQWRGAAVGDVDGDGAPDVVVSQLRGGPTLLRNATEIEGGHLRLRPRPASGAADACGARVTVSFADDERSDHVEEIYCGGEGLASSHERVVRIGALEPDGSGIANVAVRWPDASVTRHEVDGGAPGEVVPLHEDEGQRATVGGSTDGSADEPSTDRSTMAALGAAALAALLVGALLARRQLRGRRRA